MNEDQSAPCPWCAQAHFGGACNTLRLAAEAGATPLGVPLRVQGAYLEARSALRANAPAAAVRTLQWLLAHLAEARGVKPDVSLSAKVRALSNADIISSSVRAELVESALSPNPGAETAWALMTLVEHALARLYLRKSA